jgi:hypothetical protein
MERLGTAAMRARWVAQARVGHNESQTEYARQYWFPDGTPACLKDLPEPYGKAECEQTTDKEVGDLHPSLIAQTETAPIVVPCTNRLTTLLTHIVSIPCEKIIP